MSFIMRTNDTSKRDAISPLKYGLMTFELKGPQSKVLQTHPATPTLYPCLIFESNTGNYPSGVSYRLQPCPQISDQGGVYQAVQNIPSYVTQYFYSKKVLQCRPYEPALGEGDRTKLNQRQKQFTNFYTSQYALQFYYCNSTNFNFITQ